MPHKRLVPDGLWYCLRPSFSPATFSRSGRSLIEGRRIGPFDARRCYGSNATTTTTGWDRPRPHVHAHAHDHTQVHAQVGDETSKPPDRQISTPGAPENLAGLPTAKLEMKLEELSIESPNVNSASQILRILIRDRRIRPGVRHYRALILANSDAKHGSPGVLRALLEEMEEHGVPADSGTLHAALQVLAVHPDYLLRHQILQTLRDRWLSLSPAGWHYVVAGLLRENQFELALDHIAQMERKDIAVEDWLHALLVYNLGDFGEHDEVLRLMRLRVSQGYNMTVDLWQYVLDTVSAAVHSEATRYVWFHTVQLGYLKPVHEACNKVLTVAARTGDTDLAVSVIRYMADSDMALSAQDYRELVETHATAGSLTTAFEVLCSMGKTDIPLDSSTTQPILTYMIREKIRAKDAWNILKRLKQAPGKHDAAIPQECARVVLALCEHDAQNNPFAVDEGIELYKDLYTICPEGADVTIYNTLISMCRRARNRDAAMFAVKEMASLGVIPNSETFEALILMCLDADNFQSAYLYLQDMLERGLSPDEATQAQIRDKCYGASDQYAVQLKYHPKIRGDLIRAKEPGDALVPKERIKKPSVHSTRPRSSSSNGSSSGSSSSSSRPRAKGWMIPNLSKDERRAVRNERRKAKRRRKAIAETREEEGWMEYQPGGLEPEVKT